MQEGQAFFILIGITCILFTFYLTLKFCYLVSTTLHFIDLFNRTEARNPPRLAIRTSM